MAAREASPVIEYAELVCDYLNTHVLDEDLQLATFLDALASCGVTLTEDPEGQASVAYFQLISKVQDR